MNSTSRSNLFQAIQRTGQQISAGYNTKTGVPDIPDSRSVKRLLRRTAGLAMIVTRVLIVVITISASTHSWADIRFVSTMGGNDITLTQVGHNLPDLRVPNTCLNPINTDKYTKPCASIAWAVRIAASGDVIKLIGGPFAACNIPIDKTLVIDGFKHTAGSSLNTIDAGSACRHFIIGQNSTAVVTMEDLELINGSDTDGGSIFIDSRGTVILDNVLLQDNLAANDGGAIYSRGTLNVINQSRLADNQASFGGAIKSTNYVEVTNSEIIGNTAEVSGGGIQCDGCTLDITDATLDSNTVGITGGALNADLVSTVTIKTSSFSNNTSNAGNGGAINNTGASFLDIADSMLTLNSAWANGGGIANLAEAKISGSSFTFNTVSQNGAGIFNTDLLSIDQSEFSGNTAAVAGGAISNIPLITTNVFIRGTTFNENSAAEGGAIHSTGLVPHGLRIVNSTLSSNSANNGAAIDISNSGSLSIANSTLFGHVLRLGNGAAIFSDSSLSVTMNNSIVDNTVDASGGSGAVFDCFATSGVTGRNNLTDNCLAIGSTNLGPVNNLDTVLADNGGTTATHRLLAGSNAIDKGFGACLDPNSNQPLLVDQRLATRPLDGDGDGVSICDIGAYEF